jgi:hypothetical protein
VKALAANFVDHLNVFADLLVAIVTMPKKPEASLHAKKAAYGIAANNLLIYFYFDLLDSLVWFSLLTL